VNDFVAPRYGDRSLGDVVPAVAAALGSPLGTPPTGIDLPDASAYVVFLVDGLGAELLARHASSAPFLAEQMDGASAATAGVPSTTATSLTSLGTGLPPGAHGLVGYTSRIPGTDKLLNALMWDNDVDPREWQPSPTAFGTLSSAGLPVTVVNKREFRGSGLTEAGSRGATFVGADRVGERIVAVAEAAAVSPSLTYCYDGDVDWTGHRFGVDSHEWREQLTMIDYEAERLREALPPSARLVIVADHGMVDSPASARIDVESVHELRDGVSLIGGEARFRHLYCAGGAVPSVVQTWSALLGDRAVVLSREDAIGRGWFGAVTPSVLPRLGDVVVACTGDTTILDPATFPYEHKMVGFHGSLTPEEMLIPLIVC
jgi:hypothetical protein